MNGHVFRFLVVCVLAVGGVVSSQDALPTIEAKTQGMRALAGLFRFHYDEKDGRVWLEIERFEDEFLQVSALRTGLGSNPVGLDRSQLGETRYVLWRRVGPSVFLVQRNLGYRAVTENEDERRAVSESFPESILFGTKIAAKTDDRVLIDLSPYLLADQHDIAESLSRSGEGSYSLDKDRAAIDPERLRSFPRNCHFESLLTFAAKKAGRRLAATAPDGRSVTARLSLQFVAPPEPGYTPRDFHPGSGYRSVSYQDYAAPLGTTMTKAMLIRHRLQKANPDQAVSSPVKPIIYYLDPGVPEPVRGALLDGARWWNQGFEAAGFRDAFRVEMLPEGADPLDVRYNVIQWVHRRTRGWSYGSSVVDPRTGEILKGHVLLGSLRVRHDVLLMEGLEPHHGNGCAACAASADSPDTTCLADLDPLTDATDVALARLRQLGAHEVGHTLGLVHNFAASSRERASVMDYPAPLVGIREDQTLDLTKAYGIGLGAFDLWVIRYGYSQFREADEEAGLRALRDEALANGLIFLTDRDARPVGGAHPLANLWDNGSDPVAQLEHELKVRRIALAHFSERNVAHGTALADLERVFVPVHLHHRYAVTAAAKSLGGVDYRYAVRGDGGPPQSLVPAKTQALALEVLLKTLEPETLRVPDHVLSLIPPPAPGTDRDDEVFGTRNAPLFDPLQAAHAAARHTVSSILDPARAGRLYLQGLRLGSEGFALHDVIERVLQHAWSSIPPSDAMNAELKRVTQRVVFDQLVQLMEDAGTDQGVRATARAALQRLWSTLEQRRVRRDESPALANDPQASHEALVMRELRLHLERSLSSPPSPASPVPAGSPIGDGR